MSPIETLSRQMDTGVIHTVADLRSDTPTDQALAEVRAYLHQRRKIAIDPLRLQMALSVITTGADNIARGRVDIGLKGIRNGVAFLRDRIAEAQS